MKKAGVILTSIIGGAILGSAITILTTPKSGEQMREDLQKKLSSKLEMIHAHIEKCRCMMMGDCSKEEAKMDDKMMM